MNVFLYKINFKNSPSSETRTLPSVPQFCFL